MSILTMDTSARSGMLVRKLRERKDGVDSIEPEENFRMIIGGLPELVVRCGCPCELLVR